MNADKRETARIYQFPAKSRNAPAADAATRFDQPAPRMPTVEFGSGWYHEAAIKSEPVPPRAG